MRWCVKAGVCYIKNKVRSFTLTPVNKAIDQTLITNGLSVTEPNPSLLGNNHPLLQHHLHYCVCLWAQCVYLCACKWTSLCTALVCVINVLNDIFCKLQSLCFTAGQMAILDRPHTSVKPSYKHFICKMSVMYYVRLACWRPNPAGGLNRPLPICMKTRVQDQFLFGSQGTGRLSH